MVRNTKKKKKERERKWELIVVGGDCTGGKYEKFKIKWTQIEEYFLNILN